MLSVAAAVVPSVAAESPLPRTAAAQETGPPERSGAAGATVEITKTAGEAVLIVEGRSRPLRVGEVVPVKAGVNTAAGAAVALTLSNGTLMHLSGEGEMTLDVFDQEPFTAAGKVEEMAAEPSVSRVVLRLVRGELAVQVPQLRGARGSSLNISTEAGLLWTQTGATTFLVKAASLDVIIAVAEGEMRFRPPSKDEITIAAGEQLKAEALGADLLRAAESGDGARK